MSFRITRGDVAFVIVSLLLVAAVLVADCFPQSTRDSLVQPCAGTSKAFIRINGGNVDLTPCPTKSVRVNGSPIAITGLASLNGLVGSSQTFATGANDSAAWSSSGTAHTLRLPITSVSGNSRKDFFPFFDAANTLAKSPFSWDGNEYKFDDVFESDEFQERLRPGAGGDGFWAVGDYLNSPTFFITLTQNGYLGSGFTRIASGRVEIGDVLQNAGTTRLVIDDVNERFDFENTSGNGILGLLGVNSILVNKTITPAGTNGSRTIEKPFGTVNVAPGASSLVVTNANVTSSSLVFATANFNDATCAVKSAVPGSGSFTITMTAACTAATKVAFSVYN